MRIPLSKKPVLQKGYGNRFRKARFREFLFYSLTGCILLAALWAPAMGQEMAGHIKIFMCGDVMTGRGIDQVLPHPCDPVIYEPYLKSARGYVKLAEEVNGPIEQPVSFAYIWGDALEELDRAAPHVRLINLETSITDSNDYWKGKGINYRMHPRNIASLTAAGIDACTLANNHVLDWGYAGLSETLASLETVNIKTAGAGRNAAEAGEPAVLSVAGAGRVLVFAFGLTSSGIPINWAAGKERAGVNLLPDLSDKSVHQIQIKIQEVKRAGDIVVASIHWGGNWGYDIPRKQMRFAHRLIDEGVADIIHGHSSHHVKAVEVYRDRLILYGCGDFLNDYEGIGGYEEFRADLSLMYFATVNSANGKLAGLQMIPTRIKRFKVNRASRAAAIWLMNTLNREGASLGTSVKLAQNNRLTLHW
jgi:poly-gamma-glutamate capsule biosynthesis protein CapA/YwtB (metallophosphatase superfamily)